jgi:hypothetical protein
VLQIEIALAPSDMAYFTAMSVSMVSPDWLIEITRVWSSSTGSRYRNSWLSSTSTDTHAHFSMAYLAVCAA